jgi:hypothetical protein
VIFQDYPQARFHKGDRIHKVSMEPGDLHPLGATGTVRGSIGHPDIGYGYIIEWDDLPGVPVFTIKWKVELIRGDSDNG